MRLMILKAILPALCCATLCLAGTRLHPRLQVDAALLKQIRALREDANPAWKRLEKGPRANAPQAIYARMLQFLVTGDRALFDAAWQGVRAKIYRNGTDRQGGLT